MLGPANPKTCTGFRSIHMPSLLSSMDLPFSQRTIIRKLYDFNVHNDWLCSLIKIFWVPEASTVICIWYPKANKILFLKYFQEQKKMQKCVRDTPGSVCKVEVLNLDTNGKGR